MGLGVLLVLEQKLSTKKRTRMQENFLTQGSKTLLGRSAKKIPLEGLSSIKASLS